MPRRRPQPVPPPPQLPTITYENGLFVGRDGDTSTVLGDTLDAIPLARRPKAIDLMTGEVSHDPLTDVFKRIMAQAALSDGCLYGTIALLYERTSRRVWEFFMGTKLLRPVSADLNPYYAVTVYDIDAKRMAGFTRLPQPKPATPMRLKGLTVCDCPDEFDHDLTKDVLADVLDRFLSDPPPAAAPAPPPGGQQSPGEGRAPRKRTARSQAAKRRTPGPGDKPSSRSA